MFQLGDKVFVEDSAMIDIGFQAWCHVQTHRDAIIKQRMTYMENDVLVPESEHVYAVEWPEEFPGGWNCYYNCQPKRGQFIAAKHLSLKFEESREVETVPYVKTQYEDAKCMAFGNDIIKRHEPL